MCTHDFLSTPGRAEKDVFELDSLLLTDDHEEQHHDTASVQHIVISDGNVALEDKADGLFKQCWKHIKKPLLLYSSDEVVKILLAKRIEDCTDGKDSHLLH